MQVIGDQILTFVELSTFFARIEAIPSSRPSGALSDDINDLEILTPANFLIGRSPFLVPEPAEDTSWQKVSVFRIKIIQAKFKHCPSSRICYILKKMQS